MPTPTTLRYVFDRTGVSVDNLVIGEPHTLPAKEQRAFAPLHGAFYYDSLKVRERNTGRELIKGIDYVGIQYYKIPSTMTGKEVYAVILVKDEAMTTEIEIDYQVVGGEFSYSNDSIARFLNELDEDNRSVNWNDILHKPDQFDAAPHYTDIGDIYGFEYVIQALEQLRSAILIGDRVSHDEIYKYVNALGDSLTNTVKAVRNDLQAHANLTNNPHAVTKTQVGLGNVQNFGIASTAEAQAGTVTNKYTVPAHLKAYADAKVMPTINNHISNKSNPHAVTKTQVGLGFVQNYSIANMDEAKTGFRHDRYMTPLRVKEAIAEQAGKMLERHIKDKNNPHNVTRAQVGLSDVMNYGVASIEEAIAGILHNKYMTPSLTKRYSDAKVMPTINNHISNKSNPHAVTKAQVGLGNVDNTSDAKKPVSNAVRTELNNRIVDRGFLSTLDLNTLGYADKAGIWFQNANANATTSRNYPIALAGTLFITKSAYSCQQLYIPFNGGNIYTRGLTGAWNGSNGPWSSWEVLRSRLGVYPGSLKTNTLDHNGGLVITNAATYTVNPLLMKQGDIIYIRSTNVEGVQLATNNGGVLHPPANRNVKIRTTNSTVAVIKGTGNNLYVTGDTQLI